VSTEREQRALVLAIILAGYLLILLDVSILMAALPRIHHDLGFSPTGLSWAQNAYALSFGGLLLPGISPKPNRIAVAWTSWELCARRSASAPWSSG
jgi:hypothetical protein